MKSQTAVVCAGAGQYRVDHAVPVPSPAPGMILCAVRAVALNPADWKMIDFSATASSTLVVGGHEFAGEVAEVGHGVTSVKTGDRVLAPVPGLNQCSLSAGAFCQYTTVAADMVCRIPDGVSYEDAAGLSVVTCTAGLALYQALRLPLPGQQAPPHTSTPTHVLVSGGASATGTIAIQLLKACVLFLFLFFSFSPLFSPYSMPQLTRQLWPCSDCNVLAAEPRHAAGPRRRRDL